MPAQPATCRDACNPQACLQASLQACLQALVGRSGGTGGGGSEDALTPADIIDERCVRCHAAGATDDDAFAQVALDRWPTLKNYVYSKQLDPISTDILAQSTHAHALSIPIFTLIVCAMALATGCPRWLRHGVAAMTFVGLLLDFDRSRSL